MLTPLLALPAVGIGLVVSGVVRAVDLDDLDVPVGLFDLLRGLFEQRVDHSVHQFLVRLLKELRGAKRTQGSHPHSDLPWEAAFLAGRCFLQYRRRGGARRSPLPDFYIAAHAATTGRALLTRDRPRYLHLLPMLEVISPD